MLDTTGQPGLPPQSLDIEARYSNVIDAQFVSRALATEARCVRGARWATRTLFQGDAPGVLATAYYEYNRSFEALASVEGALAHVIRQGDTVALRLAGPDQETLNRAESLLREQLPEPEPDLPNRVAVDFSHFARERGVAITTQTLTVPSFADVRDNYPQAVRRELDRLGSSFTPGADGRLLLWHGPPGCGKTWALRALASQWRDWCSLRYVTDPEVLLNEPAYLVSLLNMRGRTDHGEDGWRLIVMEDTGELLCADAKQQSGQGLSRLLNVVDGLLGETSNALFLITTNEDLSTIHPAIARPGRCAQLVEFARFNAGEANAWLESQGSETRLSTPATLAELFAIRNGTDVPAAHRRPVGFR